MEGRGPGRAAAECLRLTAAELKTFDIIDEIVPEPEAWMIEGAESGESNFETISAGLKSSLTKHLDQLTGLGLEELLERRYQKFRKMGEWI